MTISIDELIENSFVISIDQKKYNAFAESFRQAGFSAIPRLIDGFKVNAKGDTAVDKYYKLPSLHYPILGNSFTHASIVKYGKTFDRDFVCIFEDDAFPCANAAAKLSDYLIDIPDSCNLLKLGYNIVYDIKNAHAVGQKYFVNFKSWGSHAYIVFKKYYDAYMKLFERQIVCDAGVFNDSPDTMITAENLFIQRTIAGNTKPINRLNNPGVTSFEAERIDLNRMKSLMTKSRFLHAGDMLKA